MKKCYKCQEVKDIKEFSKNKRYKDGLSDICKTCKKKSNIKNKDKIRNYYENNKGKAKEYRIINKDKNSEYMKIYSKEYYDNPSKKYKKKQYTKEYSNIPKNIIIRQQKQKEWKYNNPEYHNEYMRNKYKKDIIFRIKSNIRSRLFNALKGNPKHNSVILMLGCSIERFKGHMESMFKPEMTWDNHGLIWEVDHIRGCCNFNFSDFEQQKQCFHYTNFQPLFKTTAISQLFGYIGEIGNRNKPKMDL